MEYIRLLRPHQWVKNLFVLLPFLLAGLHGMPPAGVALALAAFCLASSAIYVVNDIFDAASDAAHPVKKRRPIASGAISAPEGWAMAASLAALALLIGWKASPATAGFVGAYALLNTLYSFWTKHVPILDCASIALGFCMRFLAGGVGFAIAVPPLLLASCYFGAMSMALVKRRIELSLVPAGSVAARPSLKDLTLPSLDLLVGLFGAVAVALYAQWAIATKPLAIFTLPCLSIVLSRIVWLAYLNKKGEDFSKTLLGDFFALGASAVFLAVLVAALHL